MDHYKSPKLDCALSCGIAQILTPERKRLEDALWRAGRSVVATMRAKQKFLVSDETTLLRDLLAEKGELSLNAKAMSERELNNFAQQEANTYLWGRVNAEEGKYIVKRLVDDNDTKFANSFFFKNQGPSITKIVKKLCVKFAPSLIDESDNLERLIRTSIYEILYDNGNWTPLKEFKFNCSIYSWIETVTSHGVVQRLVDDCVIENRTVKNESNTRLSLKSWPYDVRKLVVDECARHRGDIYPLLCEMYVDKLPDEEIMARHGWSVFEFRQKANKADKALRRAILNAEEDFTFVLSEKERSVVMVSSDCLNDLSLSSGDNDSELADMFSPGQDRGQLQDSSEEKLNELVRGMDWNDDERYIFDRRFNQNEKPAIVARALKEIPQKVYSTYFRLRAELSLRGRAWYGCL